MGNVGEEIQQYSLLYYLENVVEDIQQYSHARHLALKGGERGWGDHSTAHWKLSSIKTGPDYKQLLNTDHIQKFKDWLQWAGKTNYCRI